MERHIYQITGVDDRERGFTRQIEVAEQNGQYQAMFRYEKIRVEMKDQETERTTIEELIRHLHNQGYTQLQTRLQFQGDTYLGTQELWTEFPDPLQVQGESESWWGKLFKQFRRNPPEPQAGPSHNTPHHRDQAKS